MNKQEQNKTLLTGNKNYDLSPAVSAHYLIAEFYKWANKQNLKHENNNTFNHIRLLYWHKLSVKKKGLAMLTNIFCFLPLILKTS